MMHIAIWKQEKMPIYFKKQAQIRALLFDKTFTKISTEYSNYSDIFSAKYIVELPENTRINKHAIKLEEGKQPSFVSIYSLKQVELEILKTYIKTNLANGFIQLFKSLAWAFILFDRKPDRNFRFCLDYWGFNNITIKN